MTPLLFTSELHSSLCICFQWNMISIELQITISPQIKKAFRDSGFLPRYDLSGLLYETVRDDRTGTRS